MIAAYVMWDGAGRRHYAARTRPIAARARRRHNRRRWTLNSVVHDRLMRAAMAGIDRPCFRVAYPQVGAA